MPAHESAEKCMVSAAATARPDATCGEVLAMLREQRFAYTDNIVIVDAQRHIMGVLPSGKLAASDPSAAVKNLMQSCPTPATLDMDQERAASLAIQCGLAMIPVVDDEGKFVGVVPSQTLLTVLRREHIEDLHRLTGVTHATELALEAIEAPPMVRTRHRLPWLLVGLAGSIVTALVMARFDAMLQSRVAIAFFVPGIVYLADAIGTQTEAIAVRGLSLSHLRIGQLLLGEMSTGVMIGVILGLLAFLGVWAVMHDFQLALSIGVALIAAGIIATMIGLLLPWSFQHFGYDPAYGSGPVGTVIQDVLSLLVYFTSLHLLLELPAR